MATVLVVLVAVIHVCIVVLEMFLWTTPRGHKAFDNTPEFAEASKVMAANQGLYNGFLAAGLVYGLVRDDVGALVLFTAAAMSRSSMRRPPGRRPRRS